MSLKSVEAKPKKKKIKISPIQREILKRLGPAPVLYGNNPPKRIIRKINIDSIKIDSSYQRAFRPGKAQKIATWFDIEKMGIPLLNERGGEFFCVDGQHSIAAIKIINGFCPGFLNVIECEVVEKSGPREEADLFVGRNDRAKMSALMTFKAKHRSGNTTCIRIANILNANHIHVDGMKKKDTIVGVSCIVPVEWSYEMGVLEDAIKVIKSTYGLVDEAFGVTVFHPVAALIAKNRGIVNLDDLVKVLSKFTPAGLVSKGVTDGRKRTVSIANFIVESYNKTASKTDKLDKISGSEIS